MGMPDVALWGGGLLWASSLLLGEWLSNIHNDRRIAAVVVGFGCVALATGLWWGL